MSVELREDGDAAFHRIERCMRDLQAPWHPSMMIFTSVSTLPSGSQAKEPPGYSMKVCPTEPSPMCYIIDQETGEYKCILCMKSSKPAFITWGHMDSPQHKKRSQPGQWEWWLKYNLARFGPALGLESA